MIQQSTTFQPCATDRRFLLAVKNVTLSGSMTFQDLRQRKTLGAYQSEKEVLKETAA